MNFTPESIHDCLAITKNLEETMRGVTHQELQRLTFLACIISLYAQRPLSDWGYSFSHTKYGTPFSTEVSAAIGFLEESKHILSNDGRYVVTDLGNTFYNFLSTQSYHFNHILYINAACGSASALPPGTLAKGLNNEPTISSNKLRENGMQLLYGAAIEILYEHFQGLYTIFPKDNPDLLSAAVTWLLYVADEPLSKRMDV
ncbi:MAG: hypothetical protein LBB34_03765 [Holosporales bacterium]|nr:hypothetical protein [Holosporales bacterium]